MISDTDPTSAPNSPPSTDSSERTGTGQIVTFQVGGQEYAFDILELREIVRPVRVTRIPLAPDHVEGVANLRGEILPIVDLRKKFGIAATQTTDKSRILVIDKAERQTGLIVDAVHNVTRVEPHEIDDAPPSISTASGRYLSHVSKIENNQRLIMNLDSDKICEIRIDQSLFERASNKESNHMLGNEHHASGPTKMVLIFESDAIEYCLPIDKVQEVIRIRQPRRPANAPPYLRGILSLRKKVLPVIDLRSVLGRRSIEAQRTAEVLRSKLNFEIWAEQLEKAIAADSVSENLLQSGQAEIRGASEYRSSNDQLNKAFEHLRLSMQSCLQAAKTCFDSDIVNDPKQFHSLSQEAANAFDSCTQLIKTGAKDDQRIVVIKSGSIEIGLQVDRVKEIKSVPEAEIEAPPTLSSKKGQDLAGVAKIDNGKRMILLLNPDGIIPPEERDALAASIREAKEETSKEDDPAMNQTTASDIEEMQLVCFRLGDDEFGAPIQDIREIDRVGRITPVPEAPSYIDGIANLRGEVLPVVDMRKRFGMETLSTNDKSRIIVADIDGIKTGLRVDSVSHVLRVPHSVVSGPPKQTEGSPITHFIEGIAKAQNGERIIVILDLGKLLHETDTSAAAL